MARTPKKKAGGTGKGRGKTRTAKPNGRAQAIGGNGDRDSSDAVRANFLQHRSSWNGWMAKKKAVDQQGKDVKAALKADGFLVEEMQVADMLQGTAKKEQKIVGQVRTRLRVARWIGHAMGAQFDLFENATVAVERIDAADLGKQAAMEGQRASPPETLSQADQQRWLEAFHAERDRMVREGIKKPEQSDDSPAAGWGKSQSTPAG